MGKAGCATVTTTAVASAAALLFSGVADAECEWMGYSCRGDGGGFAGEEVR